MTALFLELARKEDCTENLDSSVLCESLCMDSNILLIFSTYPDYCLPPF